MKNVVYYHTYLDDLFSWSHILIEHLFQIDKSGLLANVDEFRFTAITQDDYRAIACRDLLAAYASHSSAKFSIEFVKSNYKDDTEMLTDMTNLGYNSEKAITETYTMIKMQRDSQNEDMNICYLHSKTVTSVRNLLVVPGRSSKFKNKFYWRQLMNDGVIKHWKTCVEKLDEGYDVVGGDFLDGPAKCFRGNFFWTKSPYVRTLDDISDENWWKNWKERLKDVDPWLYNSAKRFGDERWICSNPNVKTYETVKNDGFYIDNDV